MPRAHRLQCIGAAIKVRTANREERDPLTIAQPLGIDRLGRLIIDNDDQVRHRGQHLIAAAGEEIFVLDIDFDRRLI